MPNMGLGGNSSMESVAVLTNHLRQMLADNNWRKPSSARLEKALAAYQEERLGRMKHIYRFSSNMSQGWKTPWFKFLSTWILPAIPDSMLAAEMAKIISGAPTLDFLAIKQPPPGRIPWEDADKKQRSAESRTIGGSMWSGLTRLSLMTALAVALYYYHHGARLSTTIA